MHVSCSVASVHRISGLTLPTATHRVVLVDRPDLRAIIGTELDDLCAELDVSRAVATLLLRGCLAEEPDFDEGLAAGMRDIVEHRRTEGKGRVLLFVESIMPTDLDLTRTHHEANGMVVGFDLVVREPHIRNHDADRRNIIAALSLASGRDIDVNRISQGLYCHDDGKRYLSYRVTTNAASVVVSSLPEALAATIEYVARCAERADLARVVRLAADAATASDRFRVWLSAWTALEILVTTRFKRYERIFIERLRLEHGDAPTAHYLARAADVMAARYRLLDRFAIVAGCLVPETAAADMEEFARMKKQRDAVTHGAEVDDRELRADAVRQLLRRYLDADLRFGR